MIMGIVRGIQSCIGAIGNAVSNVANTIRSVLHFSVPDEGPLTDYESWMPDFMSGLASGIEKSRGMVKKAVSGVASDMVLSPQLASDGMGVSENKVSGAADLAGGMVSALRETLGEMNAQTGDIVIPVYLGGSQLDEIIITAQQRANLRSGGR